MSSAERTRRWRERSQARRMAVRGEAPFETVAALIETGELSEAESQSPELVVAALVRVAERTLKIV